MSKKKNWSKLLAFVLAFVMTLSMVPGAALAAAAQNSLEESGGLTLNGAAEVRDENYGKVISVTAGWDKNNSGHASFNNPETLFKRSSFTLLADVKIVNANTEAEDKKAAFAIGTAENSLHIFTKTGKFGYGHTHNGDSTNGGLSENSVVLENVIADGWNALALVYEEAGGKSSVAIYLNGALAASVEDVGFQLSEMSGLTAMLGRSFSTNYLLNGLYDNIVVTDSAMAADAVIAETAARALAKGTADTVKDALRSVIAEAEAFMAEDGEYAALRAAVDAGKRVMANESATVGEVNAAAVAITEALNAIKPISSTNITVNGADVAAAARNRNGLTFKGFGILDANGTDALLLDYKAQNPDAYWELMELLFGGEHPIMNHVKIEMGNDKNTSTSPAACTMRTEDEYPDVTRNTGFQIAADAKSINPDVKVSILRWCAPGWVSNNNDVYKWYKNTILAAYREYGYMVDLVNPDVNESADNFTWIADFANRVATDEVGFISDDENAGFIDDTEKALFRQLQIITSDEVGVASNGDKLVGDAALREIVDVIAYHYNPNDDAKGNFKRLAEEFDKEIWNSEAQATFGTTADRPNNNMTLPTTPGTGIGGYGSSLEMALTLLKGFVNSRRTHFIYQPAIEAYYEGSQYNYKSVVSARDPWSGYINYDAAMNIMAHFSKFAVTGWENEDNTAGIWRGIVSASASNAGGTNPVRDLEGRDNYMTLAAPDKTAFSTIFINDSEYIKEYKVKALDMALGSDAKAEIWETRAADAGEAYDANYMQCVKDNLAADADGYYVVKVKPWSIVTLTTLDIAGTEKANTPDYTGFPTASEDGRYVLDTDATGKRQDTSDNILYADDYDYKNMPDVKVGEKTDSFIDSRGGADGFYPLYTHDTNGAFEVVLDKTTGNGVLRMNGQTGGGWWNGSDPATTIGDYRWANYKASVDFDLTSTTNTMYLGVRQRSAGGGSNPIGNSAYSLGMTAGGSWVLNRYGSTVASGAVAVADPTACTVALQAAGDTITVYIEGVEVAAYTDPNPQLSGRVQLACGWAVADFDNLIVETVPGYTPYYADVMDNLHMKAWGGESAGQDALIYTGAWSHSNQTSSGDSQRTRSTSSTVGASVSYTFTGIGLDLIGDNNGSAKVDVIVDGEQLLTAAPTVSTASHQAFFSLRGLKNGEHTVTIAVAGGTLAIDSVAYVEAIADSSKVDTTALKAALAALNGLVEEDYDPDSWAEYQKARESKVWGIALIQEAVNTPAAYGLDQQGADQLTAYLEITKNRILAKDAPIKITTEDLPQRTAMVVGEALPAGLPSEVPVLRNDGTADRPAKITWEVTGDCKTPYAVATLVGTVEGGKNPSDGSPLTVTIPTEIVPENLVYFIDTFSVNPGENDTTPVYEAVKAQVPDLVNQAADQLKSNSNTWGLVNQNLDGARPDIANDKISSGIYAKPNKAGVTLSYQLTLEPGTYILTSAHQEWWSMTRPMKMSLSYGGTVLDAGSCTTANYINNFVFMLEEQQTVTYTVTSTAAQAPVISWLAVAKVPVHEPEQEAPIFQANAGNDWAGLLTFGTVTQKQDAEKGEILHMNAAGATYIQFDPEAINFTSRENMTVSFDMKSETEDGYFFTFGLGQDSSRYFFLRTRANEAYTAITKSGSGGEQKDTGTGSFLNKWVHVDMVFTPEAIKTYANGKLVTTIDKTLFVTDLGTDPVAYLGKSFYSADKYFAGAFANIAVYNRPLTDEEIAVNAIYDITVDNAIENGAVSVDKPSAKKGETITVTVTPDEYFQLAEGSVAYYATGDAGQKRQTNVAHSVRQMFTAEPTQEEIDALPENTWLMYRPGINWGGGSESDGRVWANTSGAYVFLKFTGTEITLNGYIDDSTKVDIYLDGELVKTINAKTSSPFYTNSALSDGPHTIKAVINDGVANGKYLNLYGADISAPVALEKTVIEKNEQGAYTFTVPGKDVTVTAAFESDGTVLHDVTYELTNLTKENAPARVVEGETLNATLTADEGYELPAAISVTMGGVACENYTYSSTTGAVSVPNVTGAVTITAAGEKVLTPITGSVTIHGTAKYGETLTAVTTAVEPEEATLAYQWCNGGDEAVGTESTYQIQASDIGKEITLTVTGTGDYKGSLTDSTGAVAKADQAPPVGVAATDCTGEANDDGAITGVTAEMEYSSDSGDNWAPITGTVLEHLAPGKYQVRYAETDTHAASDYVTVAVLAFGAPDRADTPQAVFEAADMTLSNVTSDMKYSVDGGAWVEITDSVVDLSQAGLTDGSVIRVYQPGDGETTSDSDEQMIPLTQASQPAVSGEDESETETGAIAGTTEAMEYRKAGDTAWSGCAADATEVEPGVYEVRVKGAGTVLASEAVTVTVKAYEPPVTNPVTGVRLDRESASLYVGDTLTLTATVEPAEADNRNVTWKSSDEGVATVDENGVVKAVSDGEAVITVTTEEGGFTAGCTVRVSTYTAPPYIPPVTKPEEKPGTPDVVENEDGSVTTTETDPETGAVTKTTEYPDGKTVEIVTMPEGGKAVTVTGSEGEKLAEISLPAEIPAPETPFTDIPAGHWSEAAVNQVAGLGLFTGTGAGVFDGGAPMTRGMLTTVLHRLSGQAPGGENSFEDVPEDAWYSASIAWAARTGIVTGVSEGRFAPEAEITRESLAAMLYRYAKLLGLDTDAEQEKPEGFTDSGDVSDWAAEAMAWAVERGILQGNGSALNPGATASRAEVAVMISRFVENLNQ